MLKSQRKRRRSHEAKRGEPLKQCDSDWRLEYRPLANGQVVILCKFYSLLFLYCWFDLFLVELFIYNVNEHILRPLSVPTCDCIAMTHCRLFWSNDYLSIFVFIFLSIPCNFIIPLFRFILLQRWFTISRKPRNSSIRQKMRSISPCKESCSALTLLDFMK